MPWPPLKCPDGKASFFPAHCLNFNFDRKWHGAYRLGNGISIPMIPGDGPIPALFNVVAWVCTMVCQQAISVESDVASLLPVWVISHPYKILETMLALGIIWELKYAQKKAWVSLTGKRLDTSFLMIWSQILILYCGTHDIFLTKDDLMLPTMGMDFRWSFSCMQVFPW